MKRDIINRKGAIRRIIIYLADKPREASLTKILKETKLSGKYFYKLMRLLQLKEVIRFEKPPEKYRGRFKLKRDTRTKGYYSLTKKGEEIYDLIIKLENLWGCHH